MQPRTRSFVEMFRTVFIAAVAVIIVRTYIAQPFLVSGSSMDPTFHDGNYLLVDEISYRFDVPERGDVIVFRYPRDNKSFYIKRVIGLPGERVVVADGAVRVGTGDALTTLEELYLARTPSGPTTVDRVLEGDEYFVMGDNRGYSFDSRHWGPVPRENITGVVRARLWPVSEAAAFHPPTYGDVVQTPQ
jgi:signal peptidase I